MIVLTEHVANLPAVRPILPPTHLLTDQPERTDVNIRVITHVI